MMVDGKDVVRWWIKERDRIVVMIVVLMFMVKFMMMQRLDENGMRYLLLWWCYLWCYGVSKSLW